MTTLIADPSVVAIPLTDNGDPLVDLRSCGIACIDSAAEVGGTWVRTGLAERLVAADAALPLGVRLLVVEGFRSVRAQSAIVTAYTRSLRQSFPDLDEAEVQRLSTRYVAPLAVAPHVAGAAVDLTLVSAPGGRRRGAELWMGTAVDATPEQSGGACAFDAPGLDAAARRNRALLANALGSSGLVNYPTEWWHWSYGDRYWAYATGATSALYGPTEVPAGPAWAAQP